MNWLLNRTRSAVTICKSESFYTQSSISIHFTAIVALLTISFFSIFFNFILINGLSILRTDDLAVYASIRGNEGLESIVAANGRGLENYLLYPSFILFTHSIKLARWYILVIWMIPCSFLFYLFYKSYLHLPFSISLMAALLPNITPNQIDVPQFVLGSYIAPVCFFGIFVLLLGLEYINDRMRNKYLILLTVVVTMLFLTLSEASLFIALSIILIFIMNKKFNKKFIIVVSSLVMLSIARIIYTLMNQRIENQVSRMVSFPQILSRIKVAIFTFYPLSSLDYYGFNSHFRCFASAIFVLILFGFLLNIVSMPRKGNEHIAKRREIYYLYVIGFTWIFLNTIVYLLFTPWFSYRYLYPASFGFALIFSLSLSGYLRTIPLWRSKYRSFIVIIFLVIAIGLIKNQRSRSINKPWNDAADIIRRNIATIKYPPNSQIVMIGDFLPPTSGYWMWSSGLLKYISGRTDLSGNMPTEINYYDPFRPGIYFPKMSNLTINKPLFLFRVTNGEVKRYQYALRWLDKDEDHNWILLKIDEKSGQISTMGTGDSLEEYLRFLGGEKINPDEVLWGNSKREK